MSLNVNTVISQIAVVGHFHFPPKAAHTSMILLVQAQLYDACMDIDDVSHGY